MLLWTVLCVPSIDGALVLLHIFRSGVDSVANTFQQRLGVLKSKAVFLFREGPLVNMSLM